MKSTQTPDSVRKLYGDSGSMSIEAVLVIPVFLLFLALILAIGRACVVREDLHAAAVNGARVASMETSPSTGETAGKQAIQEQLAREGTRCQTLTITLQTSDLDLPPGEPGSVTASLSCVVRLADLSVPGLPGSMTITASFTTAMDTYSQR